MFPSAALLRNVRLRIHATVAVAGSAIKWLKDSAQIINDVKHFNVLAESVEDSAGLYFVTAFGGLLAPYWDPSACGMLIGSVSKPIGFEQRIPVTDRLPSFEGITSYTTPGHIARATMEAACFHTRAVVEAMKHDSNTELKHLKVDGGMTNSDMTMQLQADLGGFDVVRPEMREYAILILAPALRRGLNESSILISQVDSPRCCPASWIGD